MVVNGDVHRADDKKQTFEMEVVRKAAPSGKVDYDVDCKPKMSKATILKNVFVVSLGFTFLFTAFNSMANLQTSLNKEEGVGAWSMSTIYVTMISSCMFLPNFVIGRLGCKWTIPISMVGYILFMCANFHAVKGTMIPSSIILGLGAAPLWSAKCTYLTQLGVWYAKLTNRDQDAVINMFFGFFFLFFQSSQIWGNLISSLVFTPATDNQTSAARDCGAQFNPHDAVKGNKTDNFEQPHDKVFTVCGIYLGSAVVAAVIVSIFLDQIVLDKERSEDDRKLSPRLLVSTFRHLASSPIQLMLIPITIYSGLEQAFMGGDFTKGCSTRDEPCSNMVRMCIGETLGNRKLMVTGITLLLNKAYISCTLGIWNLGYIMICYGVADAVCSILFGRLVQYVGHIPFFIFAFITHGSLQISFLYWEPHSEDVLIFYVCAALWGMADAVIQTQLNALYGSIFSENAEAAFANYRLWESLGFAVTFAYNDYLRTDVKLYICLGVLGAAVVCYTIVEGLLFKAKKKSADITSP